MGATAPAVLIIGVGNDDRGDDAAGLLAARRVRAQLAARPASGAGVAVVECTRDPTTLTEVWEGAGLVFLLDAVQSGAPPGTIRRFEAGTEPLVVGRGRGSTHALGVAEAVELARALGRLPPRLIVYGIEATTFVPGTRPTPAVDEAASEVAGRVLGEIPHELITPGA
ncbi:MAG: hydrogenase maturation protease [Armatimonadota bacterium]|nr:hydrogenase maturation protease [Armatimonadota bacterium]